MAKAKTTIKKITQNAWECTKIFKTGEIEKRIVKDPIDIWSIGNTGVRNPWRIPGGYKVYVESNQVGKIRTAQEQKLFKEKLLLAGEIGGDPKKDADASITRKYRLMFNKYGFAYPEVLKKEGFSQKEIGKIDDITPAGWAFYHANTIQAQQECFLRGLVVQMEPLGERETYSPLRWVLKMHEFSEEEYNLMKKYGGTCLKCGCKNSIQEKRVLSDEERSEIEEIEKKDNLLEREQYQLLKLLQYSRKDKTATELAQELDVSWQKIGWIAKKIEEDYCYLKKEPRKGKMYYVLSDLGREYLDSITP